MDEPREHYPECHSLCKWAPLDTQEYGECPHDHGWHTCNCDEIAAARAENVAAAAAEHLAEIGIDTEPAVEPA